MTNQLQDAPPPGAETRTQAVLVAETVGAVLARVSETASAPDAADEIRAITEAMVRLLVGVPLRSDGQLTVKSLAEEAGLRRNKLTHKHTGLKDLFYALVRMQHATPRIAETLNAENAGLKKRLHGLTAERDRWRSDAQVLARVVQVLEVENDALRNELHAHVGVTDLAVRRRHLSASAGAIGPC